MHKKAGEYMKALTLIQPWATLIAMKEKKIETRSWRTLYQGELAIHAGKKIDKKICEREPYKSVLAAHGYTSDNLPTGCVVAVCTLLDCCKIFYDEADGVSRLMDFGCTKIEGNELAFGNYTAGRYGWKLHDVKMLIEPIPAKGALNLWEWL